MVEGDKEDLEETLGNKEGFIILSVRILRRGLYVNKITGIL